jgi:hypothetical protein
MFLQRSTAADMNIRQNCVLARVTKPCDSGPAPRVLHLPVNRLHLIEKSIDMSTQFLLTPKMKGVKT